MVGQVSCGHFLSCLENYFHKNKESGQQGGGTIGTHWSSNYLTKKVSSKLIINQKLPHIAYSVCLICLSPPELIEISSPAIDFNVCISDTPIFLLKEFHIIVVM